MMPRHSIFQSLSWRLFVLLLCAPALRSDPQVGGPGPAPSNLKNLSIEELSQIEVTSPTKEPTPAFRSPVAIYVITGQDIRRSGVTTIPDALRLAPGVEVARIDANKWSVGIRGFGTRLSRSVLVLIDGRTVYTPLFAGTYWEVQDTLLEDIDRIEVIRGPGGTIWGPNAVNGVINIITKSSKDTQGTFAQVGGGNEEQGFFDARYGGGNNNGLTYRAYGKGFTRGPEHHFDHDNFDDWRGLQGGFRMDWGSPDDQYTISGDAYKQEDGERVAISTYVPPFTGTTDGNANLSGGNVLFRWARTFSPGDDVQIEAYYDRTNRYEPNLAENRDTFDIDLLARTKIGNRQELLYGLEGRVSDGHFHEITSGLVFSPFNQDDYLVSGFVEDDITLLPDKLLLTLGTKALGTNYVNATFEPSARLLWTPNARQTFWAAVTHAVRTPSDAEEDFYLSSLIGAGPAGLPYFARFSANPNFAPEKLNGYEAGYRQLLGKNFYLDVASFYNHYHDLFSEDVIGQPFLETSLPFSVPVQAGPHYLLPAQFRNDLVGYTKGIEVAPEWRPMSFWRLRGSYSFLHMNLANSQPSLIAQAPSAVVGASPRHESSIESSFDLPKNLELDLMYRYVSALPAVSAPGYSTGDARIGWRFGEHYEFAVVGENLFQPYHVEYGADPGGPVAIVRSVYASLSWRTK